MSTITQARDAVLLMLKTAWDVEPLVQADALLYDDVMGDKPGYDSEGRPKAYGRATITHLGASTERIGLGQGVGGEEHQALLVVQLFAPAGNGRAVVDAKAQAVKRFFQRKRIPAVDGWFTGVEAVEVPSPGPWVQTNVSAPFRYSERVT